MVTRIDPKRKDEPLNVRFPFLEYAGLMSQKDYDNYAKDTRPYDEQSLRAQTTFHTMEYVQRMGHPRFIKSHMPFTHLPPGLVTKAKVFYVCRHPFDVFVSHYFHHAIDAKNKISLEEYLRAIMAGKMNFGGYMRHLKVSLNFVRETTLYVVTSKLRRRVGHSRIIPMSASFGTKR